MKNRVLCHLGVTLPLAIATIVGFTDHNPVFAQLTPDNTLGAENSTVTVEQFRDLIRGGAIRGNALFHSFDEFNVNELGQNGQIKSVFFDLQNNGNILNILTRVTGSSSSQILGTLGVLNDLGNANLFLLNPNGITFGANASLQLNGSFFATTADGLGFDNFTFSASGEEAPPPLLIVSIPRFASFRDNPGDITIPQGGNLTVNQGQSLSLLGGNISVSQGTLAAPGISIDLGGVTAASTVNLNPDLSFVLPDSVARGDVSLTNGALISTSASTQNNGGDINIQANSINLDNSNIFTQVEENSVSSGGDININTDFLTLTNGAQISASTLGEGNAGNITISATDAIFIDGGIQSTVTNTGFGNAGSIDLVTDSLILVNGGFIGSSTFGLGNAGSISIVATNITLDGVDNTGFSSGIQSAVTNTGSGEGGNIDLVTDSLILVNGGFIGSSTFGLGNAGDISIVATNITLDGVDETGFSSGIQSAVTNTGSGDGGNIEIATSSLSLTNGALISAGNFGFGMGNAGNININARNTIFINGVGTNSFSSGILASVQGIGSAGDVNISTSLLSLTNGGNIQATVRAGSEGRGGSINILTDSLNLSSGAQISATTFGRGDVDGINIRSESIIIDGFSTDGFSSSITANVLGEAEGDGGNINISTSSLSLTNGGFIGINTFAQGEGGSIVIDADAINLDGISANDISSSIQASVGASAEGNVGDIFIGSNFLELTNGAQISTATFGVGDAGNITIDVTETLNLDGSGSGIFSNVGAGATGDGGFINIDPEDVTISNGAAISVSNFGVGDAGQIIIISDNLTLLNNGLISAQDNSGAGGFIDLRIEDVLILDNSTISAAGTQAGSLDLQSTALVMFDNSLITVDSDNSVAFTANTDSFFISSDSIISVGETNFDDSFNTQVSVTPTAEVETIEPDQQITQSACYDFGGDSQLANSGRGGIPQIPGLVVRNSVVNVELVDEVLPPPPPEAIKPHHRTDVTFIDSEGEEFKPAMGAVLLPNGMVEFVDYNPAEVYRDMYRDMYAAAGCSGR